MPKGKLNVSGPPSSAPLRQRFWSRVDQSGACWLWLGVRWEDGYGRIVDKGRQLRAHRVSWEIHNGPVPEGLDVLHRCDNPPCVRPDHLFLGTDDANRADMISKGRHSHGEWNATAKLTEADVQLARGLFKRGVTMTELARRFGISDTAMGHALSGKTWRHVK